MTRERWHELRRILDRVFERPPEEWDGFVARACGGDSELHRELASLVRSYRAAGTFIDRPAVDLSPAAPAELPERVGAYRIRSVLGQGGMGTVYLAERDDGSFVRRVAVKVIRGGARSEELARRLRAERQVLAQLEHPHIERLLDGGTTADGWPYLVMEHVDGMPIDRFCAEHDLDLPERLRLFCQVCRAVDYAHQNQVVHRDLKPANILVTERGEPKLLDFGIAKLLAPDAFPQTVVATAPGVLPMTPEYASPEQRSGGAITTASDIYSLGVLLYELLTGHRPGLGKPDAPGIGHLAPARPSAAPERRMRHPRWTRDLDNVVLMALREEPRRRYSSAEDLAHDLERYQRSEPVKACRDTLFYRGSAFVRRHRVAVTASLGAFALLFGLMVMLLSQHGQLIDERDRARRIAIRLQDAEGRYQRAEALYQQALGASGRCQDVRRSSGGVPALARQRDDRASLPSPGVPSPESSQLIPRE